MPKHQKKEFKYICPKCGRNHNNLVWRESKSRKESGYCICGELLSVRIKD